MDINKAKELLEDLKHRYDRARTSYEMAKGEIEKISKELKAKGLSIENLDGTIKSMQDVIAKKESRLMKLLEKHSDAIRKIGEHKV